MKNLQKPTLRDLDAYAVEIGFDGFDGQAFLDHYDMVGWVVGRNKLPMKDWKAAVRTWRRNQQQWASERATHPAPETWRDKKARLNAIDDQHIKEYVERIAACRSWHNSPEQCPMGDPFEIEADLLRKAENIFGRQFMRKLHTTLRQNGVR